MTIAKAMPLSVVRRLTKYFAVLQDLKREDTEWVSSQELADTIGLTSSTVRQDLTHINFYGKSKLGYQTAGLEKALADVLGADTEWRMVVVGAGNLGRALALHEEFGRRGFKIHGIFDDDEKKIGRKVGRLTVQSMDEMPASVRKTRIDIGIIAVPPAAAQSVADMLIISGVRGLLNMALTHIVAPRRVAVIDARVIASLQELTHAIKILSE
jgi:redox-sensing transcriptional repressor